MITFRVDGKEYRGSSALEIVGSLSEEAARDLDKQLSVREFMLHSLTQLRGRIPVCEVDVSHRLDDEIFALGYLYLRDEYGVGELVEVPRRRPWAHPL